MTRPPADAEPWLIPLADALRWVVACLEEADGVHPASRMGLLPGQVEPQDLPYTPVATGPEYGKLFTLRELPLRRWPHAQSKGPPPQPRVPRTPDAEQLALLLLDRDNSLASISDAERRLCTAHDWLHRALCDGGLKASGWELILPRDGGREIQLGRDPGIDASRWVMMDFDYQIEEVRSRDDDHQVKLGRTIVGQQVFTGVELDGRALADALLKIETTAPPVEILLESGTNDQDVCEICWDGKRFRIDLANKGRINRAMRAFVILLRNQNRSVAYHLLDKLKSRDIDTKQQSASTRQKARELGLEIRQHSLSLYDNKISLAEAHRRLDEILARKENEGPSLRSWAPWAPTHGEGPVAAQEPSASYATVVANARLSIDHGIEAIRYAGASAAADYLDEKIIREDHAARFDPCAIGVRKKRQRRPTTKPSA
jgi:hypothetical protein